jgi:hypothetical protein
MTGFLNVVFISGRNSVVQVPIITVLESYEKPEVLYMVRITKAEVPHTSYTSVSQPFFHGGTPKIIFHIPRNPYL